MAGQGSLCRTLLLARFLTKALRRVCARLVNLPSCVTCVFAIVLTLAFTPTSLAEDLVPVDSASNSQIDVHLDVNWSASEPRPWNLRIALVDETDSADQNASIDAIQNRCASKESTGAITLSENRREIGFHVRAAQADGAIRFRVRASRTARLKVIFDDASPETEDVIVAIADVLAGREIGGEVASTGEEPDPLNWSVGRVDGDALRIDLPESPNLLEPNSEFTVAIRASSFVEQASQSLFLSYALYRVGHGRVVSDRTWPIDVDEFGNTKPIVFAESAPPEPGVYEIRCSIESDQQSLWTRLRRRDPPLLHVGEPIIVLPPMVGPSDVVAEPCQTVGEIRPSHVAAWSVSQWLPAGTNRLIPGSEAAHDLARDKHAGTDVSVIGPAGQFQATVPVMTPGLPHKITLRYPAGRPMRLQVDVARVGGLDQPEMSFLLVDGDDFQLNQPSDKRWASHTFVHYPRKDDQIRLTNLDSSNPCVFESITVQAGPSHLTTPRQPAHRQRLAAIELTDFGWIESLSIDTLRQSSVASCQAKTIALYQLWIATDRLRDYVIVNGMNAVCVPVISGGRVWFDIESFQRMRLSDHVDDGLETFLTLMDRGKLTVFLGADGTVPLSAVEAAIRREPALAEQVILRDRKNEQTHTSQYNAYHPLVADGIARLIEEIGRRASDHQCFAGVTVQTGGENHLQSIDANQIDDSTLAIFADSASTESISLPELRRWVSQQGKATFQEWRASTWQEACGDIANGLDGKRLLFRSVSEREDSENLNSPRLPDNVDFVRNFCRAPIGSLSHQIRYGQALPSEETATTSRSVVSVCDSTPVDMPPTPVVREKTYGDVGRAIDRFDPPMLLIRSSSVTGGLSDPVSEMMESFCALPDRSIRIVESIDPAGSVVAVRAGEKDGHFWMSIANRGPWPMSVDIECSADIDWQLAAGTPVPDREDWKVETEGRRSAIRIGGGKLILLKSVAPASGVTISPWTSRVSGGQEALDDIKKDVTAIVARLGMLSDQRVYPVLSNGGFETEGGVGLVGWLHAQHPPNSVRVDSKESVEGERSVLLTTDQRFSSRTWLVSETFSPPESGRLAVSLACRGELRGGGETHRLRVSIEGTHGGQPLRKSIEFDLPRDGKWQSREVILQVDGIERSAVQSLRLTIDSLSVGRVWIDDVRLHDWFPLAKERDDLQSQAFLAVQGLQRGNLTPSARLLQNHWAKFLLTQAASSPPPAVIDTTELPAEPPGVAERIRSWLPRRLRF